MNCKALASVAFPKSVTEVDSEAFYGCTSLTGITVADGNSVYHSAGNCLIKTDEKSLVMGCKASVIPSDGSVASIENLAFWGCTGLTNITIPEGVTYIGRAFKGCSGLTSITIPEGVSEIGSAAFEDCTSLKTVYIPYSVKDIGDLAFGGCTSLSEVHYGGDREHWDKLSYGIGIREGVSVFCAPTAPEEKPDDPEAPETPTGVSEGLSYEKNQAGDGYIVTGMGECKDKVIKIPSTYDGLPVVGIANYAFEACKGITGLVIPGSVESIGLRAFSSCSGLVDIAIEEGVRIIGTNAFESCTGLKSITLPGSLTEIGEFAFASCSGLENITIPGGVAKVENYTFTACKGLTSVTVLSGVEEIAEYAFNNCTSLTSISISDSVTKIAAYSFYGCTSLTSITVAEGNTVYHSAGSCLINTAEKTLVFGCKASVIPSDGSVTIIGSNAFEGCEGLTSITLPEGVTKIGDYAFVGCTSLESVLLPSTLRQIGTGAFDACFILYDIYYSGSQAQWSQSFGNIFNDGVRVHCKD